MRAIRLLTITGALLLLVFTSSLPIQAGDTTLINNSGTTSSFFFIQGEQTLVMNGFDLAAAGISTPTRLDAVNIAVRTPVPGVATPLVIYQDADGGDPVNATLLRREDVFFETAGNARIVLSDPVTISQSTIWVGFYLPVGFEFFADDSGSSVLTYWGWTPGSTFDLANLSTAQIFGPSNGTEPVNIDLGGVARITAEVITGTTTNAVAGSPLQPPVVGIQIDGGGLPDNTQVMREYPNCSGMFYDTEDIRVNAFNAFDMYCRNDLGRFAPGEIRNENALPNPSVVYERRGAFREVNASGDFKADPADSEKLRVPVTHCLAPEPADVQSAVIAIAYGAPRTWEVLPTVRYGDFVCAEVTHQGFISYFVPRSSDAPTLNANLFVSSVPQFNPLDGDFGQDGLLCNYRYDLQYAIRNDGFETTPQTTVRVEMRSQRTGQQTKLDTFLLDPLGPGETRVYNQLNWLPPTTFIDETHIFNLVIDPNNDVAELVENDNLYFEEIMVFDTDACGN